MSDRHHAEIGVHFMRHAPTAFNIDGRFMGTLDPPILSPDLLHAAIPPTIDPLVGYTSPLQRARQTLEAFFPDLDYHVDTRLQERALGEWAGQTGEQVRDGWPAAFLHGGVLDPRFTPSGGESLDALWIRIRSFLLDLCDREAAPILVVTHNGCIRTIKAMLGSIEIDDLFKGSEDLNLPLFVSWTDLRRANLREVP